MTETEADFAVEIVTKDGSFVDGILVDKRTGRTRPVIHINGELFNKF